MTILNSEAERERAGARHSDLVKQYRPIGPAAIAAAVAIKRLKPKTAHRKGLKKLPTRNHH
jgi:hypothetical protein